MSLDELVTEASQIIGDFETVQRTLGKISLEVINTYGWKALQDFSRSIEENGGLRRSPSTLRNYAWAYKKIVEFNLPEDLPFALCQNIAGLTDPAPFVKMVQDGVSVSEIRKQILALRKKQDPTLKEVTCPNCAKIFTI